ARVGRLRDVTPSDLLIREALRATDAEKFFARATDDFRAYFSEAGINDELSRAIFDYSRFGQKAGFTVRQMKADVDELWWTAFGKRPNPGSFADSFSRGMRVREERVARDLPDLLSRREAYTPGTLEFSQRAAANDALGVLEEFANTYGWQTVRHAPGGVPPEVLDAFGFGGLAPELGVPSGIVLQKEIPHIGFAIRPFALRRMGLADTEGGRLLRSLFRGSPEVRSGQLIINREERAVGGFEEALIRGKMPEQDIAAAKLDMARAVSKTNPYAEEHFVATVNKWNKRVLDHIASDYGLSSDQMERILRDMGRRLGWTAKEEAQTFGTLAEARAAGLAPVKKLIEEPFLISQKLNRWPMTDPAAVRRAVAEAMGTSRKFRAAMLRTLGATVPEAQFVRIPLRKAFDRVFDVVMKDIFLSVWKPLVVLRPAYVLRVVGLEEQARFLATAKGIGARLESSKLGSRLLSDLDTVLGKEVKSIPIEALVGSGDKQVVEHLKFGRPGLLPKEALANNTAGLAIPGAETWWERHYLDELSVDNWGAVTDKSPHFYDVWAHALVNQFGKDTLGAMYLRDIRQVLGEEQSIERAMAFLRSPDGRMTAERLMGPGGFTEEALRDQVTIGVKVARAYAPHPELAAAALDGTLTPKLLQSTFDDVRPLYVHGPQLELALAQKGPIKTATGRLYNVILRTPTNVLSRQPYFKHWYSKMLEGLVQEAVDAGGTITPAALKAFQATSREFALSQVKRIMFDFTRQARLGELLGWAVPFFQPFSEAFVVWGRILRQNPAVGALALHLFEAGKKSGFLRTDPDTGETVVPLSEWLGAVPIGVALGVLPTDKGKFHSGWGLSAPLSSFNFFFNSAFPIPFGNTNISVPTPGLSPGAQFILQKLLSPSGPLGSRIPPGVRQRFASWLFQYGGVTPENMIPAWMRYTLQGLVGPKWFSKEIDLQATEFLRLRQYLGQDEHDPVPGYDQAQWDALSPDQRKRRLQDWARKQARSLAFFRAFFGANSFAMPKVTFPTDQIEREYQDLTAKLGPEDATKRFLADHPDLSLLTVAKTIWAKDNESPISVPASKWVQEILTSPGGREFASEHPQWVFAIIPHELRGPDAKFDPGAFFEQVSSGVRDVLTPYQFLTKDEERKFWDGWFAEQEAWTAQQDALRSEGLSSSSDTWQKAKLAHDARVDHLRQFYPAGSAKLDRLDLGGVDPRVLSEARRLSTDSTFLQTDVGKGLAEYLALRDGIEVQMSEAGIHTLRTKAAEKMGLPERYDTTVADIEARYPDFKLAYQAFFDHDLQGVETAGDKLLSGLPPAAAEAIKAWEVQNSARQDAPAQATNDIEKNQAYTAIRQWVEQAYEQFPHDQNPAVINWATRGPDEKLNYELGLMDRPYIFMSRFDRQEILGEPSSTAAEQAWTAVDNARIEVQKFLAANPTASAGPVYNQLDAYVQQLAASNPDFAAQLGAANQWGHVQEKLLPQIFGQASQAASWWSAFFDALRTVQAVVERNDLHSDKDAGYAGLRDQLAAYVDQLKQTNPVFSHQWDYLEEQTPNPLMASFMPDTWYRLGG
ncbi:MAG TPA: hypothetical protein VGR13_02375, partial [Actinomycetota bacterium]|nr:hypothetical protein [Actinomycetota bacterium]